MYKPILIFLILTFKLINCLVEEDTKSDEVEVNTKLGKVIGFNAKFEDYTLDVFYGIQYAKAPVGKLRFKKTELIDKFKSNPFYATQFTAHCPIKEEKVLIGAPIKEDCLHLNIWRPTQSNDKQLSNQKDAVNSDDKASLLNKPHLALEDEFENISNQTVSLNSFINVITDKNETKIEIKDKRDKRKKDKREKDQINKCSKKYPVLIYFYGGVGSIFMLEHLKQKSIAYDGAPLSALGDLILVTVNYRSGPFGNLYVPGEIDGNAGFFDQALSIEFVSKYIDSFCGDSKRLTIFGNSLGSISVGFNLLSSYSNKYFQQAIMQSASPLYNQFIPDTPTEAYEKSVEFAEDVGCVKMENEKKSIDTKCLQEIPLEQTQEFMMGFYNFPSLAGDFFNLKSKHLYKAADILNIPKDKKILIGLVSNEICVGGLEFLITRQLDGVNPPNVTKKEAQTSLLARLALIGDFNTREILNITNYYTLEERNYTNSYYDSLDAIASDIAFNCPVTFFSKAASKRLPNNVFSYIVTKHPKTHYLNGIPSFNFTGVCHADELINLFGQSFKNLEFFDDSDRQFSRQFVAMLAEFVHNGRPSKLTNEQDWPASKEDQVNYISLDLNRKELRNFDLEHRCMELWWPMHRKLLKEGIAPYTKLPPKSDLLFFTSFFIVAIVLLVIIAFVERYFANKRLNYQIYY